jgi:simple sugar transport system ATP-binding protein/ribose transport system ATP-binding protein
VLVVRGGRIVAELEGDRMTEENVLVAAFAETAATQDQTTVETIR